MGIKVLTFVDNNPPQCDAAWLNSVKSEVNNFIASTGVSATDVDLNQMGVAITEYAAGADFYTDTGAADAYVVGVVGSKKASSQYFNGMRVRFIPANVNTGASTINVSGLGVKNIKKADGSTNPAAGDIPITTEIGLTYDGTNFRITAQANVTSPAPVDNVVVVSSSSNATTIDMDDADPFNPVFTQVMTENTTFTFSNPKATSFNSGFALFLTNAAGAYTPTWPGSVIWTDGTAPTLNVASKKYVLTFDTIDGGTIWYGALAISEAA